MITAELTRKIDLLPTSHDREKAFQIFMNKMDAVGQSIKDNFYTEEEAEEELANV